MNASEFLSKSEENVSCEDANTLSVKYHAVELSVVSL